MLSLNYESINYVMSQILKLSCVGFSYVSISYVLAVLGVTRLNQHLDITVVDSANETKKTCTADYLLYRPSYRPPYRPLYRPQYRHLYRLHFIMGIRYIETSMDTSSPTIMLFTYLNSLLMLN